MKFPQASAPSGVAGIRSLFRSIAQQALPAPMWQRLQLLRQRRSLAAFRPYVASHVYGGRPLTVRIADATARSWYDHDWPIPGEISALASEGRLREGATVFDIGAHHAVVALILAGYAGRKGRVIAVEASAHNVDAARENVRLNSADQVTVVHAAASDVAGEIRFMPTFNGQVATRDAPSITVPSVTVDMLAEKYGMPDVIFVDVEGFEIHVMKGAARTIRESRPDICIEVHAGGQGLEKFGTVDELVSSIPSDYTVLVSPANPVHFVPLSEGRRILDGHSRLLALSRPERGDK